MVLRDVLDYPIGNQIPDRETPAHSRPAVSRRDRQCRNLQQAYVLVGQSRNTQLMSRATHSHEMSEVPQLSNVLPVQDLGDRIRAGDEEEFRVRALGVQVPQGVYRVRRPRAVDVHTADGEPVSYTHLTLPTIERC